MNTALQTLDYLTSEEEYIPWEAAGAELGYIDTMLTETELYGAFQVQIGTVDNIRTLHEIVSHVFKESDQLSVSLYRVFKCFDYVVRDSSWVKQRCTSARGQTY